MRARLMKRLRTLGIQRVDDYLDYMENDRQGQAEVACLIDVMTTNKTSFFREVDHFHFLREQVLPELTTPRVRFWSAACSSGEEPYTLATVLCEHLGGSSARMCAFWRRTFPAACSSARGRRFTRGQRSRRCRRPPIASTSRTAQRRSGRSGSPSEARALVHFAYLNLMDPWPMKGRFQVIFCRNVMIYFDRPTQQELINRFWD